MAQISGDLTTTGSVTLTKDPFHTGVVAAISGTYGTVTFVFEGTIDGTNWFAVGAVRVDTLAVVNGSIAPSDNAEQCWFLQTAGLSGVRARVTAIASGTATFTLHSASYVGVPVQAITTTGQTVSGLITASGGIDLPDNAVLSLGDSDDIQLRWDNTDLDVLQATPDSSIKWGINGAGIDHVFYGDTTSANMTWDQSADSLILSGVAKIKKQTIVAATGTAIPVTHSGSFPITQNGAETNTLADPTFLGQTLSIFVDTDTSGARVITAASRINQAANTIMTLTEVGDFIKLEAITIAGALKWQVTHNDGVVLS